MGGKSRAGQGCLAGLPWPGQREDRIVASVPEQVGFEVSSSHDANLRCDR
jgi:hypothetical protein